MIISWRDGNFTELSHCIPRQVSQLIEENCSLKQSIQNLPNGHDTNGDVINRRSSRGQSMGRPQSMFETRDHQRPVPKQTVSCVIHPRSWRCVFLLIFFRSTRRYFADSGIRRWCERKILSLQISFSDSDFNVDFLNLAWLSLSAKMIHRKLWTAVLIRWVVLTDRIFTIESAPILVSEVSALVRVMIVRIGFGLMPICWPRTSSARGLRLIFPAWKYY